MLVTWGSWSKIASAWCVCKSVAAYDTDVLSLLLFVAQHFENSVYFFTAQKMKFSIKDLISFTEEILNRKFHFLCSVCQGKNSNTEGIIYQKCFRLNWSWNMWDSSLFPCVSKFWLDESIFWRNQSIFFSTHGCRFILSVSIVQYEVEKCRHPSCDKVYISNNIQQAKTEKPPGKTRYQMLL